MDEIIEILNKFSKETLDNIIKKANRNERLTNYEVIRNQYEKNKEKK